MKKNSRSTATTKHSAATNCKKPVPGSRDRNSRLQALLLEGLQSNKIEVTQSFWDDLKTEAKTLIKKHSKCKEK